MQRGVAYKKLNQQVSIKHALHGQKSTKQRSGQTIRVTNVKKFDGILIIYACSLGLRPLLEVILHRLCPLGARWLSIVRSREVSTTRRF